MEYYSTIKKNEIMLFADKWMELEIIMLSKVNQILKEKGHMFSFMWKIDLKVKCIHKYINDLTHTCMHIYVCVYTNIDTYIHGERENMIVIMGLSSKGTRGKQEWTKA
jgi:hypothetical protein